MPQLSHNLPEAYPSNTFGERSRLEEMCWSESGILAADLSDYIRTAVAGMAEKNFLLADEKVLTVSRDLSSDDSSVYISDILEDIATASNDALTGAKLGMKYRLSDLLRRILPAQSATSLIVAIKQLSTHFQLLQSDARLHLAVESDYAMLEYQYRNGISPRRRQMAELMAAILVRIMRKLLPVQYWPKELHFEHLRGSDRNQIRELFEMPVSFGAKATTILFPRSALNQTCLLFRESPESDLSAPSMATIRPNAYQSLVPNMAFYIRRYIATNAGGMEEIAKELGVSRASLFRRLSAVGLQFTDIVAYIRMSTAKYYLEETDVSIHDIASLIGYSEHSSFTRAFVKSFGGAPSEFRRGRRRATAVRLP
ncbi:AraC family transcriptional regulator [Acidisoma silvae]|uniref:AraC family transcriptional regulator ligand-binding domain-containing protein n=1 Tax=Acidisoma silvae TaxID=2802396 RepID=A0A963YUK2_9PROT|nr:AraC family transcriptional regulator [Acidisoma silvae]MCB8876578.1 AraC family transcriptional regulator ligand-binding domain-containing protein [Acidisoma silvae]